MKTVGKQLEEARLARNWTPELASRETKIKVDRLRDLESDDYTHFSSPTYARGFVRTYARSLGLDEYKILRQLDNKLPEDETSSFAADAGIPYVPEPSKTMSHASSPSTGLYVVMGLGFCVLFVILIILFEAYRAGVLPTYFAENTRLDSAATTNAAPAAAPAEPTARALPVDSNTPPPVTADQPVEATAPKALPVDPNAVAGSTPPVAVPVAPVASPAQAAIPVAPVAATATDAPVKAVRALPVDPAELAAASPAPASPTTGTPVSTPPVAVPVAPVASIPAASSEPAPTSAPAMPTAPAATDDVPKNAPRALPVDLNELNGSAPAPAAAPATPAPDASAPPAAAPVPAAMAPAPSSDKRLVLTASRDSFVRVTTFDPAGIEQVLYASMLHAGQSIGFGGRKFSLNIGIPSAVSITLDGINYGPHSTLDAPETFTLESRQP